jgi:hypothetical protein
LAFQIAARRAGGFAVAVAVAVAVGAVAAGRRAGGSRMAVVRG